MYNLDLDVNGAPIFSKKNIDIINCILRYDSNYRATVDKTHPEYRGTYVDILNCGTKPQIPTKPKILYEVIKSIDKINSTHLSVQNGISHTVNYIINMTVPVFENRLRNKDDTLVTEIANVIKLNGGSRFNLSFASKFCAYVSRIVLRSDNFCIYDKVIQSVLPYYHYQYASNGNIKYYSKNTKGNNISKIDKLSHKLGYGFYRKVIDETISGMQSAFNMNITYENFDHLLWYYYKGSEKLRNNLLKTLP